MFLEDPHLQRFPILGHEKKIAPAVTADFGCEFGERARVGQIQAGVGFASMAIAAGNQRQPEPHRQLGGSLIFFPGT